MYAQSGKENLWLFMIWTSPRIDVNTSHHQAFQADEIEVRMTYREMILTPIIAENKYFATSTCEAISGGSQANGVRGLGSGVELLAIATVPEVTVANIRTPS